jgi:hypothetical protein
MSRQTVHVAMAEGGLRFLLEGLSKLSGNAAQGPLLRTKRVLPFPSLGRHNSSCCRAGQIIPRSELLKWWRRESRSMRPGPSPAPRQARCCRFCAPGPPHPPRRLLAAAPGRRCAPRPQAGWGRRRTRTTTRAALGQAPPAAPTRTPPPHRRSSTRARPPSRKTSAPRRRRARGS